MHEAIISVLLFAVGIFLLWNIPSLKGCNQSDLSGEADFPQVSVIIPARNEAKRLSPLLESLSCQTQGPFEVILADDGSTDETAAIAREWGAKVISIQNLPEGWLGKSWACWQGALHSRGEVLMFLDADTWLEKDGLANLLAGYRRLGGLVTVQPYHVTFSFYEQFSAIINIVLMAGLNAFTPFGNRLEPSGGFGPCLVCSREDYFRVGGHSAVKNELLEDMALAKTFLRAGLPVNCFGGSGTINFRMYPNGLRELTEGWSRGLALGAGSIRLTFLLLVSAWICGCFGAFADLVRAIRYGELNALSLWLPIYALYAGEIRWMLKRIGRFHWWTFVLYPIPLIFFALLMLYSSLIIGIWGQVRWRDRVIHTGLRRRD